jgi:hypothetical protein
LVLLLVVSAGLAIAVYLSNKYDSKAESATPVSAAPALHELFIAYCINGVDRWLEPGFGILRTCCETHGISVDRDWAASEALAASVIIGNRVLTSLDQQIAFQLERSAVAAALQTGISPERLEYWDEVSRRATDDEAMGQSIGPAFLLRCGLTSRQLETLPKSTPLAIGGILFAEAIVAWRRAQDHGTNRQGSV